MQKVTGRNQLNELTVDTVVCWCVATYHFQNMSKPQSVWSNPVKTANKSKAVGGTAVGSVRQTGRLLDWFPASPSARLIPNAKMSVVVPIVCEGWGTPLGDDKGKHLNVNEYVNLCSRRKKPRWRFRASYSTYVARTASWTFSRRTILMRSLFLGSMLKVSGALAVVQILKHKWIFCAS